MHEEGTPHHDADMVAVVTGALVMAAAVMALALVTGCVHVTAHGPAQVKLVDLDRQLDVSITPADDSEG